MLSLMRFLTCILFFRASLKKYTWTKNDGKGTFQSTSLYSDLCDFVVEYNIETDFILLGIIY